MMLISNSCAREIAARFISRSITGLSLFVFSLNLIAAEPAPQVKKQPQSVNDVVDRAQIIEYAAKIDQLVASQLRANKVQVNPKADDATLVRRLYLDIIGRIPTKDETLVYLHDDSADKHLELVEELLDSEGYVSHQFNYLADLLRIKGRLPNISGQPYVDFVKDSLRENKHYDQFVYEMLAAEGPAMKRGNGATGYYMRDFGMPEDNMSNTVRVFLGTRLECAQCHDHPFDKWTQRDYFEMVAFTGGVVERLGRDANPQIAELYNMVGGKKNNPELRRAVQRMSEPLTFAVEGSGTGLVRLPENYLGSNGESFEIVTAKTMFEKDSLVKIEIPASDQRNARNPSAIDGAKPIGSRAAYAKWLTSPQNPRFAQVIANRLWKRAMGIGLIEPVDDINDLTIPSNPALMEYLTELMVKLDFDMKQFMRVIHSSQIYQREVTKTDITDPGKYDFPGPVLRRMSGEQLWDSLLTLTVPDIDERQGYNRDFVRYFRVSTVYDLYDVVSKMSTQEIMGLAQQHVSNGLKPVNLPGYENKEPNPNAIRNASNAERKKIEARAAELRKQFVAAQKQRNSQAMKRINRERELLYTEMFDVFGRQSIDLVRASELPAPAPPGHLVRQFGQSDREQIENSNVEAAVPQVLSLMNGFIETRIAHQPFTVLMKNVSDEETVEDRIEAVFLTMLNRYPTKSEVLRWRVDAKKYPDEAPSDVIWVLANSNEFMFIR
jgi:hypothetical protein